MEIKRELVDKNCDRLRMCGKLIKVGSTYFWQSIGYEHELPVVHVDLSPYAYNRGKHLRFRLIPLEEWHLL